MLVAGYVRSGVGVELTSNSMVSAPFVTSHKVDSILGLFFRKTKEIWADILTIIVRKYL